jgi:Uri superfamily endonuclease
MKKLRVSQLAVYFTIKIIAIAFVQSYRWHIDFIHPQEKFFYVV